MCNAVQKTNNPVLVDTYAQKVSHRLDVASDAVRAEFAKKKRSFKRLEPESDDQPPEESDTVFMAEQLTSLAAPLSSWFLAKGGAGTEES